MALPEALPSINPLVAAFTSVAFVIEISETPSLNNSNLFTVVEVTVYAKEILYQIPVDKVEPFVPICVLALSVSIKTPPLVMRALNITVAKSFWNEKKRVDVAFGSAFMYR